MKFQKTLLASAISLMLLNVASCSDSGDQDSQEDDATSFTGLVVDGRVARGFVWVDTDDDSIIDTYEPYAYTDVDGYYSYNPLTNTNYCDIDLEHDYCLNTAMVEGDFTIKIAGGVDLSTGEPFKGVMTLYTNLADAQEVEQQVSQASDSSTSKPDFIPVVSPLTSLAGEGSATEKAEALTKLGLEGVDESNVEDILTTDYTDFDAETAEKSGTAAKGQQNFSRIFGYAFQYQKTIDTITSMVNQYIEDNNIDLSKDSGGNPSFGSASWAVERAVRNYVRFRDLTTSSGNLLASIDQTQMQSIVDDALDYIWLYYPRPILPIIYEPIHNVVQQVNLPIVNDVLTATDSNAFEVSLLATQTVVNTVNKNASNLMSTNTTVSQNAKNTVQSVSSAVQSDEFKTAVQNVKNNNQTVDVKQLADDLEGGKTVSESVTNATLAQAPEKDAPGIWAQRALSMSGLSDAGEPGRVLIFFGADSDTAVSGDVSICYAFNANIDDDDVTATLLKGTWQELNTRGIVQLNDDLVSFTIKALKRAVLPANEIDRYIGLSDEPASPTTPYGHFRFVYEDRQEVWFSDLPVNDTEDTQDFGLVDATSVTVPTNAAACETALDGALYKNLGFQ